MRAGRMGWDQSKEVQEEGEQSSKAGMGMLYSLKVIIVRRFDLNSNYHHTLTHTGADLLHEAFF